MAAIGMHRRAVHARRWPVVKGTISSASLARFRDARDGEHRGTKVFSVSVTYRYSYEGNDYVGSVASSFGAWEHVGAPCSSAVRIIKRMSVNSASGMLIKH